MSPDAIESMIAENTALKSAVTFLTDENTELRNQLEWLKRQVFGQKTERYIPSDDNQLALALGVPESNLPEKTETIIYDRKVPGRSTPHGREEIPAHLPRKEIVIMPQEDVAGMERIGEKVTEQLEYTPPGDAPVVYELRVITITSSKASASGTAVSGSSTTAMHSSR